MFLSLLQVMFQTMETVTLKRGMECVGLQMIIMMILTGCLEAGIFGTTDRDLKLTTQQLIQLEKVNHFYSIGMGSKIVERLFQCLVA